MPSQILVTLHINGRAHALAVKPNTTLLHAIRVQIGLTGTKQGCGQIESSHSSRLRNGTHSALLLMTEATCRRGVK